jgi:DNA-directed RNA polymerase specialized sigma24 family protein
VTLEGFPQGARVCDGGGVYGRVVASTTELRGFVREAVGDVYRYALALTVSTTRAEQLAAAAALRLARHVDAVGAAPVSTTRLNLVVRREVLDGLPRRRRRRHSTGGTELAPGASALAALTALDSEQRIALVLRHHDGLLLPDIAAALGVSYPEAESILGAARERLAPVIGAFDDGTGADAYARLVRSVPGPPDALADRVWVAVEAALVPDYADDDAWRVPDSREGEDPQGWEGFNAVPVDEHHVPPAQEARRVGTTLVVGAGALAALLAVAALTAPRGDDGSTETVAPNTVAAASADAPDAPTRVEVPPDSVTRVTGPGTRGLQPPAEPDLVVDPAAATPHRADVVQVLSESAQGPTPPKLADVAVGVRVWGGSSRVVVRRVAPDGTSEVWLVQVSGDVRRNRGAERGLVQAWAVDGGGVVVTMRVAGDPDIPLVAGLRAGGGGTWLRLPDGAEPVFARPDGALLCIEPGQDGFNLTTYQVLR